MKVFLDIGAHTGETLRVVQEPRWAFERIVSFEPAPSCWPKLESAAGERTDLCKYGLWSSDENIVLHNPGTIGASLSADKDEVTSSSLCDFRDAATWFAENVSDTDLVYAKINAEGAEVNIIDRLSETGELEKIDHLLIHFDIRKIPNRAHQEAPMRRQLAAAGVQHHSADEIQFGGVYRGTRN